jgi:hypothetical protein
MARDHAHIRLVDEHGELCPACEEKDEEITGLEETIRLQAGTIGRLRRQVEQVDSIDTDPKGREIRALFKRHQKATGKTNTKLGKPRVKLVRARLRDGFPFASEEAEPTLELAIDGVAAFPYRVFNRRERTGRPSDLDNGFDRALQDEKHVEELSRYGWKAKQAGWTVEDGWPEEP